MDTYQDLPCDGKMGISAEAAVTEQRWPDLSGIGLSSREREERRSGIGGSDANVILGGDPVRISELWREKCGEKPADVAPTLPMMLGQWTEAFNRQWFERATGYRVEDYGSRASCLERSWRRATLDGLVYDRGAVWEAKHVNAFTKPDDVLTRYMPQLQHNMAVMGLDVAILSVIFGNHKWETYEVEVDWLYQRELLAAEEQFWSCVLSRTPPVAIDAPPVPRIVATRVQSLEGNNAWAAAAGAWLDNAAAARAFGAATAAIKELIDPDVACAFGHGIEAKRSKSGAVTIRELGQ